MRVDKFLKEARIIKRRSVAKKLCESGKVLINNVVAKPASEVKVLDIVSIDYSERKENIKVVSLKKPLKKEEACDMFERFIDTENYE